MNRRSLVIGCAGLSALIVVMVMTTVAVTAAPAGGHTTERVATSTGDRTYEMYRPAGLGTPAPLVIVLHGGYGSGRQAESSYHWDTHADRGRFVAVFPNGVGRSWNAGTCCGPAQRRDVDDVAFVRTVLDDVSSRVSIDRSRVYVTGMSNGAMMAYRLACETDLFAAVAPVAGTRLVGCATAAPTSLLHIHGTADPTVPYTGGPGRAYNLRGTARVDGPAIPAVVAGFRQLAGCPDPTNRRLGSVVTSTADCPDGRTVELIAVTVAGHQWPGATPSPVIERLRPGNEPSGAFDATEVIWDFFAAHGL
ncbi:polyhydroxybutyrate depolymerase [Gordonia sp. HNM0687]|uniref:Polyhydroxybutyrate depolymerase n=1 Tax=Gordonia mangrovi TaxID=2665643 RepID=A0A6L7GVT1_9ACTN|nr:PHB depolymerase family esterase [Gordonia mangrovi]MXP23577.1 polyhydroxybutyrate depolymerase [Gordonia mangrovi]UVF79645.1 polyhydroxybutyrate depolymerase [Gordonia mangrovi]